MNRTGIVGVTAALLAIAGQAYGQGKGDLPPFEKVSEGYEQVVSTADGKSFFNIWKRDKDGQLLAELPRGFERQKHFFAMTMGSGDIFAGLQSGEPVRLLEEVRQTPGADPAPDRGARGRRQERRAGHRSHLHRSSAARGAHRCQRGPMASR